MKEKVYTPSLVEFIGLPLLSVTLLVLSSLDVIRQKFFSSEVISMSEAYASTLGSKLNNEAANHLGMFVFYMFLGAIAYIVLCLCGIIIHSFASDKPVGRFVNPLPESTEHHVRQETIVRQMIRSIALAGLVTWLSANFLYIAGYVDTLFTTAVLQSNLLKVIGAIVIVSLDMFVAVLFMRLFLLRTRVFVRSYQ